MAQLPGNGWTQPRDRDIRMPPVDGWPTPETDERESSNAIELHGALYIAFCQRWAPAWIDEEEVD